MLVCVISACTGRNNMDIVSPDGKINLVFDLDVEGRPFYSVQKNGVEVLSKSFMGFKLKDSDFYKDFKIEKTEYASNDSWWTPVWGEEDSIKNNYNELKVYLAEKSGMNRKLNIVFRVFNDGIGFRYEFPKQENLLDFVIMDELTEFSMPEDYLAWSIPVEGVRFYEALFERRPLSQLGWACTPITIETNKGYYLAIHEANLTDYAAMNLINSTDSVRSGVVLHAELTPWSNGDKVRVTNVRNTPWRTMIIADTPGDLMLSRIMLNLNEPCKIDDTSWIKPMRYMGIWWAYHMGKNTWSAGPSHGATTSNTKRYMDFAAKHGFGGVLVEGWNYDWSTWEFNFTRPYEDFDIAEITRYGREIGVDLIGHHETGGNVANYENQMEDAMAFYQKFGIHNVKTGYVGDYLEGERHSSQYGVRHYRKVIETAARYQLCIDNHEPVMPTGLQRTYPNLMTQEGVRGQEYDAWDPAGGNPPSHTVILPFTRGLAGPMDFTPGTFSFINDVKPKTRVLTTLAKQLAEFVVLYSPLQMASDMIESYEANPGPLAFISSCPTDWSRTVVPEAKIGEYVTVARKDKNSDDWYIGAMTGDNARSTNIRLDFLDSNATYLATIYCDGPDADYQKNPTDCIIKKEYITSNDVLNVFLSKSGGAAIRLEKVTLKQ